MNALLAKYPEEIQRILAKYPQDQKRAAAMPLLYLAQRESGYVNKQALQEIGEILDMSSTDVGSLVGFYTLYYDHPEGKHRIQVCNDLPCALRGADEFLDKLCENLGIQVGGTTADGMVTVEAVMCLAGCDRAPMFQVQDSQGIRYFENQTVELTVQLVEHWRTEGVTPEPSPLGTQVEPASAADNIAVQAQPEPASQHVDQLSPDSAVQVDQPESTNPTGQDLAQADPSTPEDDSSQEAGT